MGLAMKYLTRCTVLAVALAGLAGCKIPGLHSHAAPTGQVAATVNGQEVTVRQINAELGGANVADPKVRKMADTAALENIVSRKLLAQAAVAQGLDKTPDFELLKQRAVDGLLVELLEKKLAESVPAPTKEDADAYVTEHPDSFSQRKIYVVNQLRMMRPSDPALLKTLQPLNTMDAVEAALTQNHIAFEKGVGTLDSLGADPKLVDQIAKLPANEIFIIPAGNQLLVNQIKDTQLTPVSGEAASQIALVMLKRQRTEDAVRKQLSAIVGKGLAQVRFNKDYAPAKTPVASPPAASKTG